MMSARDRDSTKTKLPAMAVFSGGAAHLQAESALVPMLHRMGLKPGEVGDALLFGKRVRRYPICYGSRAMDLLQFDCESTIAARLGGRHPGAIEQQFVPPRGPMMVLCWSQDSLHPRRLIDDILATIGVVTAFLDPAWILWTPARIWTHSPALTNAIEKYFSGELLPIMRLVSFVPDRRLDAMVVRTEGLMPFVGQELEACTDDREIAETVRRLARIALDLFEHGAIDRNASIEGLEPGERIELRPRIDSAIVDVDIVERSTRRR